MRSVYEAARNFIYRNARPLDLARWQYHFEGGDRENVLRALLAYQNADGGFAHALEADSWNPHSSPIQTWAAVDILREIGHPKEAEDIVSGILRYLASGKDGDQDGWFNAIASNSDYPHAPWWQAGENLQADDNPSACLAGFALRYAEEGSALYEKARHVTSKAAGRLLASSKLLDMHLIACYIRLVEYAGGFDLFDQKLAMNKLRSLVNHSITTDTAAWEDHYICRPSQYFTRQDSPFYEDNREISAFEVRWLINSQLPDGSWNIPWGWPAYPQEWAVAKNWWKSDALIKNILFIRGMGQL